MNISRLAKSLFPQPPARRRNPFFRCSSQPAWVEILENRVLLSGQSVTALALTALPGDGGDDVTVQFNLPKAPVEFAEMGIFAFDADGTIGGLRPGDAGFTDAVLTRNQTLFTQASPAGSSTVLTLFGGTQLGVYVCENPPAGTSQSNLSLQTTSANTFTLAFEEHQPIWAAVSNAMGSSRQMDDTLVQIAVVNQVTLPKPVLAALPNQTIPEQQLLQLQITSQNPDGPQSDLRFQLDMAPTGASIDPATGLFRWTPSEAQGPGRFDVVVRVFKNSRPQSFTTQRFTIDVTEVNTAPVLGNIPPQQVNQFQQLSLTITATDADRPIIPNNPLMFSLVNNTITGASINPTTGLFTWTPDATQIPGVYQFTVRVNDGGSPALSDTQTFEVTVN